MRRPLVILSALLATPLLFAEPAEKPLGRSLAERFDSPIRQKDLTFDTRQGGAGTGKTFNTGSARVAAFQYEQKATTSKFETRDFQGKSSWLSRLKFWSKDATVNGAHEVPNLNRQIDTNAASVKDARDAGKTAAVRTMPGSDRVYLGPERAKLDRSVDPSKPLPAGWTGDKLEPMSVEQVRELLNKNK